MRMTTPDNREVEVHESQVDVFLSRGYKKHLEDRFEEAPVLEDARIQKIIEAIPELNHRNYNKRTGYPGVKPLEKILGFDITPEERDEAWERLQSQN